MVDTPLQGASFQKLVLMRGDDFNQTVTVTGALTFVSGDAINLDFKPAQGASAIATLTATADGHGSSVQVSTSNNTFTPLITAATLETIATTLASDAAATSSNDVLNGAFAFKLIRAGGLTRTLWYGPLILLPAA